MINITVSDITSYLSSINYSPFLEILDYFWLTLIQWFYVIYGYLEQIDYNQVLEPLFEFLQLLYNSIYDFLIKIEFTDFQFRLLREFSLILLGNLVLVIIAWSIYGPRIAAKFGVSHRGSRKTIEELRLSMSELQLPKEHDYKYK